MQSPIPLNKRVTPNQSAWTFGENAITHIVCHTPEGSYAGSINYLSSSGSQASYHILINKPGTEGTQLVPFNKKAWHALSWNSISEGISLAEKTGETTKAGEEAMAKVVAWRCIERELPPKWNNKTSGKGVCRHGDLQANRSDPMSLWKFKYRFMPQVRKWYKTYAQPASDLTERGPSYWTWRAWKLGIGPWEGKGQKDAGAEFRPRIPGRLSPKWGTWWAKFVATGG